MAQVPQLVAVPVLRREVQRISAHNKRQGRTPGPEASLTAPIADERLGLVMQWVQALCCHFDLPVLNFTTSFADGRALCLMVNPGHVLQRGWIDALECWHCYMV